MTRRQRVASDIPDDEDIIVVDEGEVAPPVESAPEVERDPIEVLKREVDEHRSARIEAERKLTAEKAERERAAADSSVSRLASDKLAIEQAYSAAEGRSLAAKRAFKDAMTAGDFDAAAEAQASIARVENEMQRYADAYQAIESQRAAPAPVAAPAEESIETAIARIPDPAVRDWATEHRADLADPKRRNLAYAADSLAVARGLEPGSDAYLDFLDEQLGYGGEQAPAPKAAPKRRGPPVAAPVSRGGGGKVSVTLTDTDKALAQQAGVTPQDYARSILAAKKDPRYNKYANRYQ